MEKAKIKCACLFCFVFTLICIFTSLGTTLQVYAAAYDGTSALYDLRKDETFDIGFYPPNSKDYSIKVIQIAESESGYLYLYTYQPCQNTKNLMATDVNMSLSESADGTKLYDLVLANSSGVFCKYLVKDIKVQDTGTRYYNITSVYRAWDKDIDGEPDNNNTVDKKAFAVRNIYKVTTENGVKTYTRNPTYVVNIIDPYVDYLLYLETASLPTLPVRPWLPSSANGAYVDSHYVAFSTDWEIDKLLSATVHYEYYTADGTYSTFLGFDCGGDVVYGKRYDGYAYPTYTDKVEIEGGLQFTPKHRYTWDRIQTVAEFIATEENLTDETKSNLAGKQWVLRFLETERTQKDIEVLGYKKYQGHWTIVDRVAVLRLEFETDGVVYNLGTVSDMQSGDSFSGNHEQYQPNDFWTWLANLMHVPRWAAQVIFWCVIGVIALAILSPILSLVFPPVGQFLKHVVSGLFTVLKYLFIGLWWIICLPFRGIALLVQKIKERRQRSEPKTGANAAESKQNKNGAKNAKKKGKQNRKQKNRA